MVKLLKKAFTIPEILIVLAIVGVIVVLMLTMVKPDSNLLNLQYMKAYNTLSVASYNIYNDTFKNNNSVMYKDDQLCTALTEYINTAKDSTCNADYVPIDDKSITDSKIKFVSSNDMRFYMTKAFKLTGAVDEAMHRIIWVDINGNRPPNTSVWTENTPADIVAFDINDFGEVIPLGYPKIDERYMIARVVFPDDELNEGSRAISYTSALSKAFGAKQFEYDVFSHNFDQTDILFADSVLKIDANLLKQKTVSQDSKCVNDDGSEFPKCTIEISK